MATFSMIDADKVKETAQVTQAYASSWYNMQQQVHPIIRLEYYANTEHIILYINEVDQTITTTKFT